MGAFCELQMKKKTKRIIRTAPYDGRSILSSEGVFIEKIVDSASEDWERISSTFLS